VALTYAVPTPVDDDYDYAPITEADFKVGDDISAVFVVSGTVLETPLAPVGGLWPLSLETTDGALEAAFLPEDPESQPDEWWLGRMAVWEKADKLDDGEIFTAADTSRWIYPAAEDGRLVCFDAGSEHEQGERLYRGEILTDPRDLYVAGDNEHDWLPVTDGFDIEEDDEIVFVQQKSGVLDNQFTVPTSQGGTVTFYRNAANAVIAWVWSERNYWTFFRRTAKPAADAKFRAEDGSRWIYAGGLYYCWSSGTRYVTGAVFPRGEIAGGLKEIT
jgi:hypothetical protein